MKLKLDLKTCGVLKLSKYKPNNDELFAKHSSLAIQIYRDSAGDFDVFVYDRRTGRIIAQLDIALVTLRDYMDLTPIKRKVKRNAR